MSMAQATLPDGTSPVLGGGPPYSCSELQSWAGRSFWMPPGDPRLEALHHGGASPCPPLDNLEGLVRALDSHPEWLDFLDPSAPNHLDKMLERSLYLHHWGDRLPTRGRVLDLGGGCGRFAAWLLDQGLDVEVVDPDLRSLWRTLQHASGRAGRLDLHWSTGEHLPPLEPVVAAVAAEVLCYVEDPASSLAQIHDLLEPGGRLFCSVEARWGWAASLDVHPGSLDALLSDGVVHVPGDVWVRTFEGEGFRSLLEEAGFEVELLLPTHYVLSGPFEAAAGELDLEAVLAWEERLRSHPRCRDWNRAWTAVARKSGYVPAH